MTIEADVLRWCGIYEEPAGSYQIDNSGTLAAFAHLPFEEGTLVAQLGRELLDPLAGKIRLDGHDKKVLGVRGCTLALSTMLASHGQDLDGDVAPVTKSTWALLRVLQTVMGGSIATTDESAQTIVVVTGTSTTVVEVTTGHGGRFEAGGVIGCQTVSGSSALELREVLSVSGDLVSVKQAFSGTPVTGTPVRGGISVYLTEDSTSSLQAVIEGREATDGVVLRGLQGGFSLTLPVGGRGQITFALAGAGWARLGASTPTTPVYVSVSPFALVPLEVTVPTLGSTTRVVVPESELAIEPQIVYAPQRSGAATETIARMKRAPARPICRGSFVAPYEDDTWYEARDNRSDHAVFAQAGNLAGSCMLISLPTVQITDVQPAASGEGNAGQRVSFEARHDEEIGGATEVGYSALRLHFV